MPNSHPNRAQGLKLASNLAGFLTFRGCGSSYRSWRNALVMSKCVIGSFLVASIAKIRRIVDLSAMFAAVSRGLK